MIPTLNIAAAFALIACVASHAVHLDIAVDGAQEPLSTGSLVDVYEDKTDEGSLGALEGIFSSGEFLGGAFASADLSTEDNCCCGRSEKDKAAELAKSQCPSLTDHTRLYNDYPFVFYCTGHIAGTKISSDKQPSLDACAAKCPLTKDCKSVDYDKKSQTCWYYKEAKVPTKFKTSIDSAVLQGKTSAQCPEIDGTTRTVEGRTATFYCSKAIDGNWSSQTKESSPLACAITCAKTDGCIAGDFDEAGKACKLITDGGSVPPTKGNTGSIHGLVLSNTKCETLY